MKKNPTPSNPPQMDDDHVEERELERSLYTGLLDEIDSLAHEISDAATLQDDVRDKLEEGEVSQLRREFNDRMNEYKTMAHGWPVDLRTNFENALKQLEGNIAIEGGQLDQKLSEITNKLLMMKPQMDRLLKDLDELLSRVTSRMCCYLMEMSDNKDAGGVMRRIPTPKTFKMLHSHVIAKFQPELKFNIYHSLGPMKFQIGSQLGLIDLYQRLLKGAPKSGDIDCAFVLHCIPGRKRSRSPTPEDDIVSVRPGKKKTMTVYSKDDELQFALGVTKHGWGRWSLIRSEFLPNRSYDSVKSFSKCTRGRQYEEQTTSRSLVDVQVVQNIAADTALTSRLFMQYVNGNQAEDSMGDNSGGHQEARSSRQYRSRSPVYQASKSPSP